MSIFPNKHSLSNREKHHLQSVRQRVNQAAEKYGMLRKNSSILIALSGGKDSYTLLETLGFRRRIFQPDLRLRAVHIAVDLLPDRIHQDYTTRFCRELDIPFEIIPVRLDRSRFQQKSPCYICSATRRKHLFAEAQKHECGQIALGHHRDDVIETALLNMMFLGNIAAMPPCLPIFQGEMSIIRPLYLCSDKDIQRYSRILKFPRETEPCPYESSNRRETVRELLDRMSATNPRARDRIFRSLSHISVPYLPPQEGLRDTDHL